MLAEKRSGCSSIRAPSWRRQAVVAATRRSASEAAMDAGPEILQGLSIVGDWNDLVPVSLICNEGIDAVVGIHEPGNDPEAKLFSRERLEHLLDCAERVSAARPSRQDQNIRLHSIRF